MSLAYLVLPSVTFCYGSFDVSCVGSPTKSTIELTLGKLKNIDDRTAAPNVNLADWCWSQHSVVIEVLNVSVFQTTLVVSPQQSRHNISLADLLERTFILLPTPLLFEWHALESFRLDWKRSGASGKLSKPLSASTETFHEFQRSTPVQEFSNLLVYQRSVVRIDMVWLFNLMPRIFCTNLVITSAQHP